MEKIMYMEKSKVIEKLNLEYLKVQTIFCFVERLIKSYDRDVEIIDEKLEDDFEEKNKDLKLSEHEKSELKLLQKIYEAKKEVLKKDFHFISLPPTLSIFLTGLWVLNIQMII
jgi:hypothetical protein